MRESLRANVRNAKQARIVTARRMAEAHVLTMGLAGREDRQAMAKDSRSSHREPDHALVARAAI